MSIDVRTLAAELRAEAVARSAPRPLAALVLALEWGARLWLAAAWLLVALLSIALPVAAAALAAFGLAMLAGEAVELLWGPLP